MNTIDLTPLYRSTIGFDNMAALIDNAMRGDPIGSSYPPYNIEVLKDNQYALSVAVAGFEKSQLDINVENGVLTIKGHKSENDHKRYLYQGIANRTFERKFNLAEYVEVTDATLVNGLLTVELLRKVPEAMRPRKIEIGGVADVLEHDAEMAE